MSNFKNIINHIKTVLTHKYWVGYYCFKAGLYWRGLTHDLSKFSPTEFLESIKYYTGTHSPIDEAKKVKGYSDAWLHHRGRNTHHYEYYLEFSEAKQEMIPYRMPYEDCVEMLCDFLGAARAYLKEDFSFNKESKWWYEKEKNVIMDLHTKEFISIALASMSVMNDDSYLDGLGKDEIIKKYYYGDSFMCYTYHLHLRKEAKIYAKFKD